MDWSDALKGQSKYELFLESPEWKLKRREILKACNNTCFMCKQQKDDKDMVVHHLAYTYDLLDDNCLIPLCRTCHEQIHSCSKELKKAAHESLTIQKGVEMIEEGFAEVIDKYVIPRCAELSPDGDIHFFTTSRKVNLNRFIKILVYGDPYYRREMKQLPERKYVWNPLHKASFSRYQEMRLKKEGRR